jgi:hypothetical protein
VLTASQRIDAEVEKIVGRLSLEPTVSAAGWRAEVQPDSEGQSFPEPPAAGQSSDQSA